MALADYRLCDRCGGKAFYDANLNYEHPDESGNGSWGQSLTLIRDHQYALDRLGDWKVLCTECAKTHRVVVEPIAALAAKGE